jgi:putative component of membrane protein insertase Oxa1/YidC/SpoIIIJ protein YidD
MFSTYHSRRLVLVGLSILYILGALNNLAPEESFAERLSKSAVSAIRFYQQSIHPLTKDHVRCRLQPTCSNFALREFKTRPFSSSLGVVARRLMLCARASQGAGAALPPLAFLMQRRAGDEAAAATCCASMGFLGVLVIFFVVAFFAVGIYLLVWVAKDAKSRGVDNPVVWMVLVLITGVIGLVIYLAVRPSGNLIPCAHCPNKKLPYARVCPHCGQADAQAEGIPAPSNE